MEIFRACLEKELREQRAHLFLLAPVTPLALVLVGSQIRHLTLDNPNCVERISLYCLLIFCCVFGLDLFGRDCWTRGALLLGRLPGGSSPVFLAKVSAFFLLVSTALVFAFFLLLAVHSDYHWIRSLCNPMYLPRYLGYNRFDLEMLFRLSAEWPFQLSYFFSSCFLLMALAAGIPRTGIALALWVALLVFGFNLYGIILDNRYLNLPVQGRILFLYLFPVTAALLAFFSFRRMMKRRAF